MLNKLQIIILNFYINIINIFNVNLNILLISIIKLFYGG